jgi:pimeloyl-ACP methyl ester carboxylesterase
MTVTELPRHSARREACAVESYEGVAHIAGANIHYTYEAPPDASNTVPMLLVPGFCSTEELNAGWRRALAASGKPAISYDQPRSQGFGDLDPRNYWHPAKLPTLAATAVMHDVTSETGSKQFDISGHSMGGAVAANLALQNPNHARTALFVASTGLAKHCWPQMLGRSAVFAHNEMAEASWQLAFENPLAALGNLHYIWRNPSRTLAEGLRAATVDIRPEITALGALGLKTGAIQFPKDSLFPPSENTEATKRLFDAYEVLPNPNANHLAPQLLPRQVAGAQLGMLARLHAMPPPLEPSPEPQPSTPLALAA